ncbi:hypothetical protein N7452_009141 [Penicillium brevicompactum]|uniref:Uncharacterized protein n=1 Tax=Penicillium brevicompactum TaxID=5074 RepID=A0A9W9Q7Y2_PENBR|nr:hypothetical protein N7452_009141 [Penicillium brevicompactum]
MAALVLGCIILGLSLYYYLLWPCVVSYLLYLCYLSIRWITSKIAYFILLYWFLLASNIPICSLTAFLFILYSILSKGGLIDFFNML